MQFVCMQFEWQLISTGRCSMWCSPTRRSFITGRYLVHITGEQAATDTNLTPLQFTILSEKLRAANFENHFLGKGMFHNTILSPKRS